MKLIIGLGNPGAKYEYTRHNAGFMAVDFFLRGKDPIACASKFDAQICELHYGTTKVLFVKPQTFMNDSGQAVLDIAQFYKVGVADLLIIHDDTDLPLGTIRLAEDSSAAGHNGVKDIFERFATQAISRIRIGVETRESRDQMPTDAFVLQNFSEDELATLHKKVFPEVNEHIDHFIETK